MGGGLTNFAVLAAVSGCLALSVPAAHTQEREHRFVLEIGPAGEWPLKGEKNNFGGSFAIESTLIENWLEIELGLTALSTSGRSEWSGDLLFKKPFRFSPEFEFMVAAGPSIGKTLNGEERDTDVSATFALDFMFWPTTNIGWFVEPTWSINPKNGHQAIGATAGILIGIPER